MIHGQEPVFDGHPRIELVLLDKIDKMDSYTDEDGFSCEAKPSARISAARF